MCSMLSGKCDLLDDINIWGVNAPERIKKIKFVIDGVEHNFTELNQLVPYYPCIIGISVWGDGHGTMHFDSESFVDKEDREMMQYRMDDAQRVYKKLKRKKEEITPETIYNGFYHFPNNDAIDKEISKRVAYYGPSASTHGLHWSKLYSYYKYKHYQMMREAGFTEEQSLAWVYCHIKLFED